MKLDGSEPFDPMRTGRVMSNTVLLPETIMDDPGELRDWFHKAFAYAAIYRRRRSPHRGRKHAAKKPSPAKKKPATKKPKARKRAAKPRMRAKR